MDAVIDGLLQAVQNKQPTAEAETTIANNFENYLKNQRLPSLPFDVLLRILDKGMGKITPDQNCSLFVNAVPYHEYAAIRLIEKTNFHNVSTEALMQMRNISMGDGTTLDLSLVRELIAARDEVERFKDCVGPRSHTFTTKGVCTKCNNGKCPRACDVPGCAYVHVYADDGRCSICGAPRCRYDGLHPFNYDGHCHICGKKQPTRCEIVGCQEIPGNPNCPVCGKPLQKEEEK
ncbi:hypothetical protein TRFO_34989 [Tritrichomonas foetus]|uniref:Uncharacterized protein n=1 Tax=Tritrichomonas foetus TaxID=1144522 RepID=A0A1J4JHI9_9EUKA|nr:hypothetical protein TRFO_34989 [Tritrichomonas foetus]|eukprot:OHS98616.1 hypothetical protein TRFO_34989 [Tritrichomonas foetus]